MKDHARFAILRLLGQVQVLIGQAVVALTRGVRPPVSPVQLRWYTSDQSFFEGPSMSRITEGESRVITVNPKKANGQPARIDGPVNFSVDDPSVASIEVLDDRRARVRYVAPGVTQVRASFDADLGPGVRTLEATGALETVEGEATTAEITFGDPEPDPPVDPAL